MPYPSDLSDDQWQLLEPLLPPKKPDGSERVGAAYGLMEWVEQYPEVVERLHTVLADAGYRGRADSL